jgi:hypothetical protein
MNRRHLATLELVLPTLVLVAGLGWMASHTFSRVGWSKIETQLRTPQDGKARVERLAWNKKRRFVEGDDEWQPIR